MVCELYFQKTFEVLVTSDTAWSIFSVCFVFCYLWYHLKSLFLATVGIWLILLSFPMTVCITEGILKVTYFSNLHTLVIFIVLGIAADDIFVFIDAWRQSDKIDSSILSDKKKRLAYSFRRAVRAMAVTSSTTSVAFFANFFSPLMPIRSFGIFAGIIVPVNYFLVVMLFPPATIFYERHFEKCCSKSE